MSKVLVFRVICPAGCSHKEVTDVLNKKEKTFIIITLSNGGVLPAGENVEPPAEAVDLLKKKPGCVRCGDVAIESLEKFTYDDVKSETQRLERYIEDRVDETLLGDEFDEQTVLPEGPQPTAKPKTNTRGSTEVQVDIAADLLQKFSEDNSLEGFDKFSAIILTPPRVLLREQTNARVCGAGFTDVDVIQAHKNSAILTTKIANEAKNDPKHLYLVIHDEAHWGPDAGGMAHAVRKPLLDCPNVRFLFVSATPWSIIGDKPELEQYVQRWPEDKLGAYKGQQYFCAQPKPDELVYHTPSSDHPFSSSTHSFIDLAVEHLVALHRANNGHCFGTSRNTIDARIFEWVRGDKGSILVRCPTTSSYLPIAYGDLLYNMVTAVAWQDPAVSKKIMFFHHSADSEVGLSLKNLPEATQNAIKESRRNDVRKLSITHLVKQQFVDRDEVGFSEIQSGPAYFIVNESARMGDTMPGPFLLFDLRCRYHNSWPMKSAFLQDVGRAFTYQAEPPLLVLNKYAERLMEAVTNSGKKNFSHLGENLVTSVDGSQAAWENDNSYSQFEEVQWARSRVLSAFPQVGKTGTFIELIHLLEQTLVAQPIAASAEPAPAHPKTTSDFSKLINFHHTNGEPDFRRQGYQTDEGAQKRQQLDEVLVAQRKSASNNNQTTPVAAVANLLHREKRLANAIKIGDFGCFDGELASLVLPRHEKLFIVGFDEHTPSPNFEHDRYTFENQKCEQDFPEEYWGEFDDIVICRCYWDGPEMAKAMLDQAAKLCKPDGRVWFCHSQEVVPQHSKFLQISDSGSLKIKAIYCGKQISSIKALQVEDTYVIEMRKLRDSERVVEVEEEY